MMKKVFFSKIAARALRRHANRSAAIREKIDQYATDPDALANNVTILVGRTGKRLRVGDFRVLFVETDDSIIVDDIGPRGRIYD